MENASEGLSIIGQRLPRVEAPLQVTGRATYTAELRLPQALEGKLLGSPHPHARILNIDTSRAQRLPGVKAVVTGRDTLGRTYGVVPGTVKDEVAMAMDRVRYVGEAVAAVAAVDEDTALEALELIQVEYEPLPAVYDPREAMKPGAPILHDHRPDNVCHKIIMAYGDVEQAFKGADYFREDTFSTQRNHAGYMEPLAAVASVDLQGNITLWSNNQGPHFLRRNLANCLGIPESKVRVIKPFMGGGFGGKLDMYAKDFCAALLALKTGRPVRVVCSLKESLGSRQRHATYSRLKTGVRRDGTILAVEGEIIADGGAYISTGPVAISSASVHTTFPFRVPNKRVVGYRVYTNKVPCGPVRGHGAPQGTYPMALQLEYIAEDLGMDPVDLLLKNCARVGDDAEPYSFFRQLYGAHVPEAIFAQRTLTSCGLTECIEKAAEAAGWREKRSQRTPYRGIGIGLGGFSSGGLGGPGGVYRSGAVIELQANGEAVLFTGAVDMGQGANSLLQMIVAEELGVALEDVRIVAADTTLTPLDPGAHGSQTTCGAGSAVKLAAADAKRQLLEDAVPLLETPAEHLDMKGRWVFVKAEPQKRVSLAEVIRARRYAHKPMPVVGHGTDPADQGRAYSFSAQIAEVEVDPDLGTVKVLRLVSADDVGTPLSPLAVEGQVHGSISNGLGHALYEELLYQDGQMLNPSYHDLKIPVSLDMPEMTLITVPTYDPKRPYGAKEAGEGSLMGTVGAIATAVYNAIGVKVNSLPLTPDKILQAIKEKGGKGKGTG